MDQIFGTLLMSSDVIAVTDLRYLGLLQMLEMIIRLLYFAGLCGLAVYGINNLVTTFLYWKTRKRRLKKGVMAEWPRVTVQLPIYNERYTIERLLTAVAALDYPRDKLQIQVLDDSTDDTLELTRRLVGEYRSRGIDIDLLHRTDRWGFKAGALAEGMASASGKLLAIFDADFTPQPDWLKKTVVYFAGDPRLACVQTRWGHLNHNYSLFTGGQALGMDGHFIVEQAARSASGLFLNFNGTAGLWRRAAIEDAGGWQPDTLTEDLDLSYRAQLRGWHIEYLPQVVVPGEVPVQVEAFKKQQFRWAKGSFQVVRKLFAALIKSDVPMGKRVMGLVHITGYFVHPLMICIFLLVLPVGLMSPESLTTLSWLAFTAWGPPLMYLASRTAHTPHVKDRLGRLPMLILIGFGISLNNTIAVVQGLLSNQMGTFTRTPKFNIQTRQDRWSGSSYRVGISPMVWGELALGLYALISALILGSAVGWGPTPWLLIYMSGNFYIAGMNLIQTWQTNHEFSAAAVRA